MYAKPSSQRNREEGLALLGESPQSCDTPVYIPSASPYVARPDLRRLDSVSPLGVSSYRQGTLFLAQRQWVRGGKQVVLTLMCKDHSYFVLRKVSPSLKQTHTQREKEQEKERDRDRERKRMRENEI